MSDLGLTHIALPVADVERSVAFYAKYASMSIVHRRSGSEGEEVVWLSDCTRPFVVVLIGGESVDAPLASPAHLGVGCESREEVNRLSEAARAEGCLKMEPTDSGYPVGYWALLSDPDGHTLELSYGQEVGLTVERS
jgi:catechol 2,3-dioxygenase-like lactoylglutathione lyase family enzyme